MIFKNWYNNDDFGFTPIWKIQDLVYDDILLDEIFQFRIKIPGISIFYLHQIECKS